jgi:hypothetical protein
LACAIRRNKNINGIKFGNKEIKVWQFVDDTTGILADVKSVEKFGEFSGLKLTK